MEMNDHSILLDVNPNVLQCLRNNATSVVSTSLRTTNVATSLGIMSQLVSASEKCEDIFEEISSKFFDLNKRIAKAQKTLSEMEPLVESKSQFLLYSDAESIYGELAEEWIEKAYEPFDFFALPHPGKKKKQPVPDLRCISKLIEDETVSLEGEYTSYVKTSSTSLHRREESKKTLTTRRQSSSIFSSIARKFMHQEGAPRLSVSFSQSQPERSDLVFSSASSKKASSLPLASAVEQSSFSQQSMLPPQSSSVPPPLPQQSSTPQSSSTPPPLPQQSSTSQPSPSSSSPPESSPRQLSPTYSPPVDILQAPPKMQRSVPPPPPPVAFMVQSGSSVSMNAPPKDVVSTPAQDTSSTAPKVASSIPPKDTSSTTSQDPPRRPLPFLTDLAVAAAARQKHIEEKASSHGETTEPTQKPRSEHTNESLPQSNSSNEDDPSPPRRAMPASLLQEIANAGTSRLDRAARAAKNGAQSPKGSLVNRAGTIRKAGTLGGGQRSERYGTEVLNTMRGEMRGHLFVPEEGEKVTEKPPPRSGNPLLDEIRGFDFSKLRKVDRSSPPVDEPKHDSCGTPGLADLLRSRLEVMQTDSESDSSDSRFEFSDSSVCCKQVKRPF